jgi:DNA-binding response OmpR family regulator
MVGVVVGKSMGTPEPASRFRFGVFELDVRAGELRKRGALVRVTGQRLRILAALLTRAGEVVSRDELHVIAATRYVPPALLENLDVTLAARANLGS